MRRIKMLRIAKTEQGTWGILIYGGVPFAVTGEREDLCNSPGRSCIPEGDYIVKRVNTPKHGDCFEIQDVPERSNILFHKGNVPSKDSEGCIIVGESFEPIANMEAVADSLGGYDDFMKLLAGQNEFHLQLREVEI